MSAADAPAASRHELRRTSLAALLLTVAGTGSRTAGGTPAHWRDAVDDRQLDWLVRAGLGPFLRWALPDATQLPADRAQLLLAADLSARVRHAQIVDTAVDVLDLCRDIAVDVTLLKGIAVCHALYPAPHMRPMGDVDVLVAAHDRPKTEAALLASGFVVVPHPDLPGQHHGPPFRHERRRTLVELHTALFPSSAPVHRAAIFDPAHLPAQRRPGVCRDRNAWRLSHEVQLAHTGAAWFDDMTTGRFHPSFLPSLFDAVLLLRAHGAGLDWDGLLRAADDPMLRAALYALLTYVTRFGVSPAPPSALRGLADNDGLVGPLQRRLIHLALDRYLLGARTWSLPFPPPMPGRYSPRHQLRKRLGRR